MVISLFASIATAHTESGIASVYNCCAKTASGEPFKTTALTAAHRTLPFGSKVLIHNHATGREVTVRINDRGPFVRGRVIDVTPAAARALGMDVNGLARVTLTTLAENTR